jgi:hypothetical protein
VKEVVGVGGEDEVVGGDDGVDELVESLVDRGLVPFEDGTWMQETEGASGGFLEETQICHRERHRNVGRTSGKLFSNYRKD